MIIFGVNYTPIIGDIIALVVTFVFSYWAFCRCFKGFIKATKPPSYHR